MKVLILSNPEHTGFLMEVVEKTMKDMEYDNEVGMRVFGEYDWSEDYEIGISFMYQYKVPAKEVNSHPWFNFHPAPLPEYKGRDLCYHAIMNGERRFGATIHYMDEGFDTGDIIEVARFPVLSGWTAEDFSYMALEFSKSLFKRYFPKILETPVFPRIRNKGGTYYKKGKIIEEIPVKPYEPFGQFVRAVTYKDFHPRIDIGGVKYKIVREE